MRSEFLEFCRNSRALVRGEGARIASPIILVGIANALLFYSIDRSRPSDLLTAGLGMLLMGTVLVRQLAAILTLRSEVAAGMAQVSVISEVISILNSSPNVGSNLGSVLDKIMGTLDSQVGAIWLPAAENQDRVVLIEQRGFPGDDVPESLLAELGGALPGGEQRVVAQQITVEGLGTLHAVAVRMGRVGEDFGYMLLMRRYGSYGQTAQAILAAVGSDIGGALRSIRLIGEARRLADRDPVTGLFNHRSAYQRLNAEIERSTTNERPFAVVMMDLDNFKLFNDTYGHLAGDDVLKRVAGVLRRSCRQTDIVARYGGDEFMLILPDTGLPQAVRCAERIQSNLSRERFRCEGSATLPIGFSYGISVFPTDSVDVLELVSVADANLYQSKTQGGNRITARNSKAQSGLIYVRGHDLFSSMVQAIDNKDGYTRKHSEEVTEYSLEIGRAMNLGDDALQTIQVAGILHDVGKIGVPDAVLRKPGRLTDEEFGQMQQHPVFGALIVGAIPGMEQVVHGVRSHHERYDGKGYPDRLIGQDIPLLGRILAVADAYSAMTTTRPYRKGLTERQALEEIERGLGTQFDPEIGRVFLDLRRAASAAKPTRKRSKAARADEPQTAVATENATLGLPAVSEFDSGISRSIIDALGEESEIDGARLTRTPDQP